VISISSTRMRICRKTKSFSTCSKEVEMASQLLNNQWSKSQFYELSADEVKAAILTYLRARRFPVNHCVKGCDTSFHVTSDLLGKNAKVTIIVPVDLKAAKKK
jgi:hypothetical protein